MRHFALLPVVVPHGHGWRWAWLEWVKKTVTPSGIVYYEEEE